jgi:hypothetical protein
VCHYYQKTNEIFDSVYLTYGLQCVIVNLGGESL